MLNIISTYINSQIYQSELDTHKGLMLVYAIEILIYFFYSCFCHSHA